MKKDISGWNIELSQQRLKQGRASSEWLNQTIADMAADMATHDPQRITHVFEGQPCRVGELLQEARLLAGALQRRGLVAGDAISFQLPNWREAAVIDLASSLKRQQEAFKQGVSTERSRISRDLHDDLSARLVSGLMLDDPGELKAVLRASLAEVRTIVSTEESGSGQLIDVLADSRAEAAERLEAAGIELSWPVTDISGHMSPQSQKALASVLREIVTNVIKHSGAGRLSVRTRLENERLYLVASDDGVNFNGTLKQGNGLKNMRARLAGIDGYFDFDGNEGSGFRVSINVPVIS